MILPGAMIPGHDAQFLTPLIPLIGNFPNLKPLDFLIIIVHLSYPFQNFSCSWRPQESEFCI